MTLKGFAAALVLALAVVMTAICTFVLASTLTTAANEPAASADAPVRISGIGNSGNTFGVARTSARDLARRAAAHDFVPHVTDDRLRDIALAVEARALQGDVEAAAFVFELAALQKEKAQKAAARQGEPESPAAPPAAR